MLVYRSKEIASREKKMLVVTEYNLEMARDDLERSREEVE